MENGLVPGRACGDCMVCCIVPAIDQPELKKPSGVECPHCASGQGCTIYDSRPVVCRTWFCGWRQLEWVGDLLRPDLSGMLISLTRENLPAGYESDIGLEFTVLAQRGLKADGLAGALARAIRTNVATFLVVPGAAGESASRWLLNEALQGPANEGRPAALLRDLKKLYLGALFLGDAGIPKVTGP